jgi:hypothetical protein
VATAPRPLGNRAAEHCNRAGEESVIAERLLGDVMADGTITSEEYPKVALARAHILHSELHLMAVGAKIEPQ